jgi:phage gp36-like protein
MRHPTADLRDRTGVLDVALVQWADRSTAPDKAAARRAGTTAVDAIDAMLRDLFVLRGRLVQEIRQADGAARRVA